MLSKNRSIQIIHERLQAAYKIRKHYYKKSVSWFNSCPEFFWGLTKDKSEIIFNIKESSYNHETIVPGKDYAKNKILIAPDKELPLMIHDPIFESEKKLLTKRLSGQIKQIPYRQSLVDEYEKLEIISSHIYAVVGTYKKLLVNYITHKNMEKVFKDNCRLFIFTIQGHTYYLINQRGLKILDKNDVYEIEERRL